MTATILDINKLSVHFTTDDAEVCAVDSVSCHINAAECVGVVGESGSGKSQTFLAVMGLLANNGHATGTATFDQHNLIELHPDTRNSLLGNRLSMIFQDPLTSLTPHMRIGEQMGEVLRVHQKLGGVQARQRCLEWLDRVHINEAAHRLKQYPHELSGGMRQRVMIAMSMLCNPELLIADEPSTALDVTVQADILDLMDELRRELGTAIVLITHDMGVVARMCDRIYVMKDGSYVESGSADAIFFSPKHAYTKTLLSAVPRIQHTKRQLTTAESNAVNQRMNNPNLPEPPKLADGEVSRETILDVTNLSVSFSISRGLFKPALKLTAVDKVSFSLCSGEILGVVGESGSGKSTLARAVAQLLPISGGSVSWLGRDMNSMDKASLQATRKDLQMIFQDPIASLDPSRTIGYSIAEPLLVHDRHRTKKQTNEQVARIMEKVGLSSSLINRYPHELSGGQNQRVGIARAMILKPKLVVCDEAVSALDVSIQAQVLQLLKSLQQEFGLSLIFISHDLSVISELAHRVIVMYLGTIVEIANSKSLFSQPQHPYTQQLLSAAPVPDPVLEKQKERIRFKETQVSPLDPGAKLRFLPSKRNKQSNYQPKLQERFPEHFVAEHDPIDTLTL